MNNDANILKLKDQVLYEVCKLAFEGKLEEEQQRLVVPVEQRKLPERQIPGNQRKDLLL